MASPVPEIKKYLLVDHDKQILPSRAPDVREVTKFLVLVAKPAEKASMAPAVTKLLIDEINMFESSIPEGEDSQAAAELIRQMSPKLADVFQAADLE